jgi:hypothetical protein
MSSEKYNWINKVRAASLTSVGWGLPSSLLQRQLLRLSCWMQEQGFSLKDFVTITSTKRLILRNETMLKFLAVVRISTGAPTVQAKCQNSTWIRPGPFPSFSIQYNSPTICPPHARPQKPVTSSHLLDESLTKYNCPTICPPHARPQKPVTSSHLSDGSLTKYSCFLLAFSCFPFGPCREHQDWASQ